MPIGTASYWSGSRPRITEAADASETSCSPDRPPKSTPTRNRFILSGVTNRSCLGPGARFQCSVISQNRVQRLRSIEAVAQRANSIPAAGRLQSRFSHLHASSHPVWLRYSRCGPLPWVRRSLAYWKKQPFDKGLRATKIDGQKGDVVRLACPNRLFRPTCELAQHGIGKTIYRQRMVRIDNLPQTLHPEVVARGIGSLDDSVRDQYNSVSVVERESGCRIRRVRERTEHQAVLDTLGGAPSLGAPSQKWRMRRAAIVHRALLHVDEQVGGGYIIAPELSA